MGRGCQPAQAAGPALAGALLGHTPGAPSPIRWKRWGSLEFSGRVGVKATLLLCPGLRLAIVACEEHPQGSPLEGSICSVRGRDPGPGKKSRQGCLRPLSGPAQLLPTWFHFHVSPPSPIYVASRSTANHTGPVAFRKQQTLMENRKEGGERGEQGQGLTPIIPFSQAWVVS